MQSRQLTDVNTSLFPCLTNAVPHAEQGFHFRRNGREYTSANCQPFPQQGKPYENMNLKLKDLLTLISGRNQDVYCYILSTIRSENSEMYQWGSGPNFQGGVVTLCTCKHRLRSVHKPEDWQGKWIAGFTRAREGGGKNHLFYLMQVKHAFESQTALWNSNVLSETCKQAKATSKSPYGDLYKPLKEGKPFDPESYYPPLMEHNRSKVWRSDINYHGVKRSPALLVGDPELSFLWDSQGIISREKLSRGGRRLDLDQFKKNLQERL